jgi:hypothetical protein
MPWPQRQFVWDFSLLLIKSGRKCLEIKSKALFLLFLCSKELQKKFNQAFSH